MSYNQDEDQSHYTKRFLKGLQSRHGLTHETDVCYKKIKSVRKMCRVEDQKYFEGKNYSNQRLKARLGLTGGAGNG